MRFGSVCSGIDAASVAWTSQHGPMDWTCEFFSEIEKFPSAVLSHHYGSNMPGEEYSKNAIPNYGDMTKFKEWPDHGQQSNRPIDLLVGGTPCQTFSIAGLRAGLNDPRGNLMLTYLSILKRYQPRWFIWENVPGVLSSNKGKDFGTFLGGLAECGYGFAYRVLDAQYIRVDGMERGVPQRRRRVFVVGYLGDWRPAGAALFESESMRGHIAPRRKERKGISENATPSTTGSLCARTGLSRAVQDAAQGHIIAAPVASTLNTTFGEKHGQDNQHIDGGAPLFVIDSKPITCFSAKDYGADATDNLSPTLRAGAADKSHANSGNWMAIAIQERAGAENLKAGPGGKGYRDDGAAYTLEARSTTQSVVTAIEDDPTPKTSEGLAFTLRATSPSGGGSPQLVMDNYTVRRLTTTECQRLQGFPDNFTKIPWRNKPADRCPDGPQYKALGNSMAVNCMRWLGQRIELIDGIIQETKP